MKAFLLSFCLFVSSLAAIESKPWFGRAIEIETRSSCLLQQYNRVACLNGSFERESFDQFVGLSAAMAFDTVATEVELNLAHTRLNRFNFECARLLGSYLIADDVSGETLSILVGGIGTVANRPFVNDLSAFFHGTLEFEAFCSIGKELSQGSNWVTRGWGLFGFGIANLGKPWLHVEGHLEQVLNRFTKVGFVFYYLYGVGDRNLKPCEPFKGYGLIRHRSLDVGFNFCRIVGAYGGEFTMEYARRIIARNFPEEANLIKFTLYYPFGI